MQMKRVRILNIATAFEGYYNLICHICQLDFLQKYRQDFIEVKHL